MLRTIFAWIAAGGLAIILVARCIILSPKRLFWGDEILTWYVVNAPLDRVYVAAGDTISSSPPLFFIIAWAWRHMFGMNVLSLRLLSAIVVAASLLVVFGVLRAAYGKLRKTPKFLRCLSRTTILY